MRAQSFNGNFVHRHFMMFLRKFLTGVVGIKTYVAQQPTFRHVFSQCSVEVPWMGCCRRSGRALIVASMSGFVGMAGFSTYAPTKFALRGLADCLRNEVGA